MAASDALMPGMGSVLGGAVALGGLAYTLGKGESPLPGDIQNVENVYAPTQFSQGQQLYGEGQKLVTAGTTGLVQAQAGKLTPEQQAQLAQMRNNETNQALQTYESQGRNPTQDTSFIATQGMIDRDTLAAAQSFIQTNIQLAMGELSSGASFISEGSSFESAAAGELMQAGQDQMKLDEDYSNAVAGAFKNVAQAFAGNVGKGTSINVGGTTST